MADDAQPHDADDRAPAEQLLAVATTVVRDWLERIGTDVAARAGQLTPSLASDLADTAEAVAEELIGLLGELLAIDVDEQPVNPLSLFRAAVAGPTDVLRRHGVAVPRARDSFAARVLPDDPYGIGPATWADIDERMRAPGLAWGAWKAMTVLRRRRDEGLR